MQTVLLVWDKHLHPCNWNWTIKFNPLWTATRTDCPSLNSNQWQEWEASVPLYHLWKSLTQYIHTPVLKRKITSRTKFITSLSLHLEMTVRLTGSLETITGWQISGAFISKNLSQLFTSSSVFRGQVENSGGYRGSKSFVSERKTLVSRHFFSSNFPSLLLSPLFCSQSFLPKRSSSVNYCASARNTSDQSIASFIPHIVGELLKLGFSSWYIL